MLDPETFGEIEQVGFFSSVLNSIYQFDMAEVRPVVSGLLSPSLLEECRSLLYIRLNNNVGSMLELKHIGHFQAVGMLARSIYELTADIQLLDIEPRAAILMRGFLDVEKLKACKSSVTFSKQQGTTPSAVQDIYIQNNEARINAVAAQLWPNQRLSQVSHWTGENLPTRIKRLSVEMQEMYAYSYKQLSWTVHSGLQGSYGLSKGSFPRMCSLAYNLARVVYEKSLTAMIQNLQLYRADALIREKLELARALPFTESPEEQLQIRRELGLPI
jgi:hypothetical protein